MSRLGSWKHEKAKVKVVFRLQFHATHIPQTGWEKLFISFIPADSGNATAKTTKANVRNGTCKWADPIYETTRLLQDAKTKRFDEKLYKFVVAMGTSRSSILGETSINLADYADALKPSVIPLPLHLCDYGSILHVTVQLLTSKTGFREFEQQRELRERGFQTTTSDQNGHDGVKISSSEINFNDQIDKVKAKVRFKPESKEHHLHEEEDVRLNDEYALSAVGCDDSSNTTETMYAERHDTSSTHETGSLKSTVSGDVGDHFLSQSPRISKGDPVDHRFMTHGNNDWCSDYSIDNDLAIAYEENSRLRTSLEAAELSINELKFEVSLLKSHADEYFTETQKLSNQFFVEISSGKELEKEVSILKSECLDLKSDLERLKGFKVKEINKNQQFFPGGGFDLDLHALSIPGLISHELDSLDAKNVMEGKFFELLRELDESKVERESLVRKMDQMESYYEALIQELEENQKHMLEELHNLRHENSTLFYTISSSNAQMEMMRQEMDNHIIEYSEEIRVLDLLNKDLERRSINSEAALKRARLNYSIAVDNLQKDLELLSCQVVSMFETQENLIKKAFPEINDNSGVKKQFKGREVILEDYKKLEEDLIDMHLENIKLDVFSKAIRENLIEASVDLKYMKEKMDDLTHELGDYKSKYETCMTDKKELESSLKQEVVENQSLQDEISSLQVELTTVKSSYDETLSLKEHIQDNVNFLYIKLGNLLENSEKQFCGLSFARKPINEDLDLKDLTMIMSHLEEIQDYSCRKILQLTEDNKDLERQRDVALVSSSDAKEEIVIVKKKFEHDLKNMEDQLDVTNAHVKKLQSDLDTISEKHRFCFESDERIMKMKEDLLNDLASIEDSVKTITEESTQKNRDLMTCLQEKDDESLKHETELVTVKECLKCLHDELHVGKVSRGRLERTIEELTSQLKEKEEQLFHFELEKSRSNHLLTRSKEFLQKNSEESSNILHLEADLLEMHELLISADINYFVLKSQYEIQIEEILHKLQSSNREIGELQMKKEEYKNLSLHFKELKEMAERKSEGHSYAVQDSLRNAFIKEQCETKIQELKHQLSISNKHGEEMLWKLQDTIDEVEKRKKSEVLNLKKIEELSSRILELESDLQTVLCDNCEKVNAIDKIQADLECCREEKEKLEESLKQCNEGKVNFEEADNAVQQSRALVNAESIQGTSMHLINDHFKTEALRSSLDRLQNELEKMKNENSHSSKNDHNFDPNFHSLQRELKQLHEANEELGSIFPSYNELSSNGNALERVLALEFELAESLQSKKKSSIQFQSSFLKRHSDDEAVFKSFKDINELIKDMLEIKGKYAEVVNELKEMHDRYSRLSLQFAEVEGEREKLAMTLKHVRTSKKDDVFLADTSP